MTHHRNTAAAIARAVMDRIEADRCCNSENIADAAFRELAVAASMPNPIGAHNPSRLKAAARGMIREIGSHGLRGAIAGCFDDALNELTQALNEVGG